MGIAWYRAGTVSVTNGNPVVVGSGTAWLSNANIGDIAYLPDGIGYEITAVTNDASVSVKHPNGLAAYGGTTQSGQAYAIVKTGPSNATIASQLTNLLTNWQANSDQFAGWLGGTPTGGPNNDGRYPLTNALGVQILVDCPAKISQLAISTYAGVSGGTANALTVTLNPPLTAHTAGLPITFLAAAANTGATTVNINGLGAVAIKRLDGTDLRVGDIMAGQRCEVIYTGTSYVLTNAVREATTVSGLTAANLANVPQMTILPYLTQNAAKNGVTIAAGTILTLLSGGIWKAYLFPAATDVTTLDTGALSNGKDYCVYLCDDGSDNGLLLISLNSTAPAGYTATNSRKIGGFHTLCASVGTISGHPLSGYTANQVLPLSVWDLTHRPKNASPNGMVYSPAIDRWVDIYMASGTGASTASVYGATITDNRNWMDFCDDGAAVNKRLLTDSGFAAIAEGSNQQTNISGSADPGTTGGHTDTAGRRMISNIGCEDCCGVEWQWLDESSVRWDQAAGAWNWYDPGGGKGKIYCYGQTDVKLLAGGSWADAAYCGSRARSAAIARWTAYAFIGGRFAAEPL